MKLIEFLNTGIFPATICLSVGFEYKELTAELINIGATGWVDSIHLPEDKNLIEGGKNFALRRDADGIVYFWIIFVDEFEFSDYEMCKLAHEVLHICQFLLPDFLDPAREFECTAYTHTHIMDQCLKAMRK